MSDIVSVQTSKRVTALRIILIFLVIVRHNTVIIKDEPFITSWIKDFISNGLFYGNVALSFIFAGYFLSIKKHSYFSVVKRKFHSLVIPYVFWMVFYFLIYLIMFYIPRLHNIAKVFLKIDKWEDFNFDIFVKIFIGYNNYYNLPNLAGQMWFLRDLIILSLMYPVIQYIFDFRKKYCVAFTLCIVVVIGFIFNKSIYYRLGLYPILFFSIGIICGLYKIEFFEIADKLRFLDLLVGIIILVSLNRINPQYIPCCVPLLRFISSLFWLKFSKILVENEKFYNPLKKLSAYSFFIYAIHYRLMVYIIQKIGSHIPEFIFNSGVFSIFWYVFAPILTLALSGSIGIAVKKIFPRFFSFITGGR